MARPRFALLLGLLLAAPLAAGCERAPEADVVRGAVEDNLAAAFPQPVMEITSFKRLGSGPLPAGDDGVSP